MDAETKAILVEETLERIQQDDPDGVRSLLYTLIEEHNATLALQEYVEG